MSEVNLAFLGLIPLFCFFTVFIVVCCLSICQNLSAKEGTNNEHGNVFKINKVENSFNRGLRNTSHGFETTSRGYNGGFKTTGGVFGTTGGGFGTSSGGSGGGFSSNYEDGSGF